MENGELAIMVKKVSYSADSLNFTYTPNHISVFLKELCLLDGQKYKPRFEIKEILDKIYYDYDSNPVIEIPRLPRQSGISTFLLLLTTYFMYAENARVAFVYRYRVEHYKELVNLINVHNMEFSFNTVNEMQLSARMKTNISLGLTRFISYTNYGGMKGRNYNYIVIDGFESTYADEKMTECLYPCLINGGKIIVSKSI
jgi:hypothetical protein